MQPFTAATLLVSALKEQDLGALRIACQAQPWEFVEKEIIRSGIRQGFSCHPCHLLSHLLSEAKKKRDGSVDLLRKSVAQSISIMVGSGYRPSEQSLVELAGEDLAATTYMVRALKKENALSPGILHRLLKKPDRGVNVAKAFLQSGVDANELCNMGSTPLHALWKDFASASALFKYRKASVFETTKILLAGGARLDIPDQNGTTVEKIARECEKNGLEFPGGGFDEWVSGLAAQSLEKKTMQAPSSPRSRRI